MGHGTHNNDKLILRRSGEANNQRPSAFFEGIHQTHAVEPLPRVRKHFGPVVIRLGLINANSDVLVEVDEAGLDAKLVLEQLSK